MTVEDDLIEAIDTQEARQTVLLNAARNALRAPLRGFRGWYDHAAIRRVVGAQADLLRGFEATSARNADAYMAEAITIGSGRRFRPTGVRRTPLGRHDIDNASVLGRIFNTFRWAQGQSDKKMMEIATSGDLQDVQEPEEAANQRLDKIVETNLQMASRAQMLTTMQGSDKITRYRRIIHPELASGGTCGLCIAASDRLYRKEELLPIHPGCHCTTLPIIGESDPRTINEIDFRQIYRDARLFGKATSAEALRQTRYQVDEHGEIGPVLRPEGQPIRSQRRARAEMDKPQQGDPQAARRRARELDAARNQLQIKIREDPETFPREKYASTLLAMGRRIDAILTDIDQAA